MKKRMMAIVLFLAVLLTGCGASAKDTADSSYVEAYNDQSADFGMYETAEESAVTEEYDASGEMQNQAEEVTDTSRKLIKKQYLTVETLEFDAFTDHVKEKTTELGGYLEESTISGNSYYSSGRRYADYTIRVPEVNLEKFVEGIRQNCNVIEFSEEADDVTLQYVDTQSRIQALKVEQDSLLQMLEKAEDLDTVLAIQSRMTEVRYELQSYESQMRLLENKIQYSTIYLHVREVERETATDEGGFFTRLGERLSDNLYNLGYDLEMIALFLLGGIPYWIFLGIIIFVIVFAVKRIRGRRHLKKLLKETKPEETVSQAGELTEVEANSEAEEK